MKGLFFASTLGAVVCVSAFAQGTLDFANSGPNHMAGVYDTDGVTGLSGSAWSADLYWAPGIILNTAELTALNQPATFSTVESGFFFGGTRTIPGTVPGETITAQVRVWDSAAGSSWAEASKVNGARSGESILFEIALGGATPTEMSGLNFPWSVRIIAQDFTYIAPNSTITITGYTGPGGNVDIPSSIDGLPVTIISNDVFLNLTNLTSVSLPESLVSIGDSAFYGCSGLTTVRLPNSVIVVGPSAFGNCSNLTSVTIGNHVASISNWAFSGCSGLTRLTIPDSVTKIEDAPVGRGGVYGGVFWGCTSLTNVIVGKGLSYLGIGAFNACSNLLGVIFKGNAPTNSVYVDGPIWGPGVFLFDDLATVYYLSGTTGWGSTFAGRPAVLWNPQIETSDASFGARPNGFGFNITGTADIPVLIEACANLDAGSWVPLQSCTLTNGLVYFSDPQWTNYPNRFYRIRSP
jgi:hypothetical protein